MKCPACSQSLNSETSLDTDIKRCSACRGMWFDQGTLPAYVKALSRSKTIQPAKTRLFERREVDIQTRLNAKGKTCPRCDVTMHVINYAYDSNVFVERCPTCDGMWTDQGEAERIAQHIKPDPKTAAIGQALADEVHESQKVKNLDAPGVYTRNSMLRFMFLPKFILPLKDDESCDIVPWATISLIVACCLVFAGQMFWIQDSQAFVKRFAFTPAQFWSVGLLTSMFLHGSIWHLLGNMFFLWLFGDNVEERLGWWRFLGLYVMCDLAATLSHGLVNAGSTVPCMGASGAISGVMGAYAVFFPLARIKTYVWGLIVDIPAVFYLIGWLGLQVLSAWLITSTRGGGIAWFAHIGGFASGLVWAVIQTMADRRAVASLSLYEDNGMKDIS